MSDAPTEVVAGYRVLLPGSPGDHPVIHTLDCSVPATAGQIEHRVDGVVLLEAYLAACRHVGYPGEDLHVLVHDCVGRSFFHRD